jgi:nitrate reductase assembly molybdenum cofactor insertion protein NarJ
MTIPEQIQQLLVAATAEEEDVATKTEDLATARQEQMQAQAVLTQKNTEVDSLAGELDKEKSEYKAAIDALIEKLTEIRNSV